MNTICTLSGKSGIICPPWGKERKFTRYNNLPANNFVAGVVYKVEEDKLWFLFVTQFWRGEYQNKFPGGRSKPDETETETLLRELVGETGLSPVKFTTLFVESRVGNSRQKFQRFFYLITESTGRVITEARPKDHPEYDVEIVGTPFWLPVDSELFNNVHTSHRAALVRAVNLLFRSKTEIQPLISDSGFRLR